MNCAACSIETEALEDGLCGRCNKQGFTINIEQAAILYHTAHRAAGGFYCGGGKDMDALIAAGLMQSAGRKSFVPDEYFKITPAGRAALFKAKGSR